MTRAERIRAVRPESSDAGPSSTGPSTRLSVFVPSTSALEYSVSHHLDALEVIVHGISIMMIRLFQHTFPREPIPGGPPPLATGPSTSAPSASTVVEVGDLEEDDDSGERNEEDSEEDTDGDGADGDEEQDTMVFVFSCCFGLYMFRWSFDLLEESLGIRGRFVFLIECKLHVPNFLRH